MKTGQICTEKGCTALAMVDCKDGRLLCEHHALQAGFCLFCEEHSPVEVALHHGLCGCCYGDAVKDEPDYDDLYYIPERGY